MLALVIVVVVMAIVVVVVLVRVLVFLVRGYAQYALLYTQHTHTHQLFISH